MAHQFLGQLSAGLPDAMEANTSIKLAGGVSAKDARALASQMSADADMIQRQPKGTFATFLRGVTNRAVPISFPFFELAKQPQTTKEARVAIQQHSRERYAEPWQPKGDHSDPEPEEPENIPPKKDNDDPTAASPEL